MTCPRPHRTIFTTLIGLAGIVAGGLGSLFSLFALLLAVGKPYASSASDPFGIFLIFILPPGTLLAGVGLLLHHRWARVWMILLMAGLLALGIKGLVASDLANPAYAPRPGPAADAAKHGAFVWSVACTATGGLVLLGLLSGPVRREFLKSGNARPPALPVVSAADGPPPPPQDVSSGWRVGHQGRDMMFYEELRDGEWRRIGIDGEMLTGRAHHVIYFADEESWQRYPEWARHRRGEIISRIKSRFREPDYEYADGGTAPVLAPQDNPAVRPDCPSNDGSILPMVAFLLVIAAACFWLAAKGIDRGEVRLPVKHNPASRIVVRAEKPALFWTGIGLLGGTGAGCTVFAGCLLVWRWRGR